jgi:hypothetical protein
MKCFIPLILIGLFAVPVNAGAQADVHPYLTDKLVVYAGVFVPKNNLELTVDGSIGGGNLEIDFEKVFDFPTTDEIFNGELNWRFSEKWSLRTQYFNAGRNRTKILENTIDWGDEEFVIGTTIQALTDIKILRLFFGRALTTRDNVDAGIGIGVHYIDLGATAIGTIDVGGMPVADTKRSVGASAPMPNIGGWYSWSWSRKWALISRLDWLEASVGELRGGITNISVGVNYQLVDHIGLGINYQDFTVHLRSREDRWTGRAKSSYRGPFIYVTGNW